MTPTSHNDRRHPADGARTPSHLSVALAGAGKMARQHAAAIECTQLADVVAIADPSAQALASMRRVCPDATAYPSLEALLAREQVDAVHICAPPALHASMAQAALEAQCHVYVEKPFTETLGDAERILALAESVSRQVCAGHQLLFEPPARQHLALLPSLGPVHHVESFFSFRTVRRTADGSAPLAEAAQLKDILPHPVYLLLHTLALAAPEGRPTIRDITVGPSATVHASIQRGNVVGILVVTLEGRPVESYLKTVGSNGTVHADFVRGTVQRWIGPGTSGIDKALNPYRSARQLLVGTTTALGRRVLARRRSYPGLREIFTAFYRSARDGCPAPVPPSAILETVRICEDVARELEKLESALIPVKQRTDGPLVCVTGAGGLLGREVTRALRARGCSVRGIGRRALSPWQQVDGVEYCQADLAEPLEPDLLKGVTAVIHCAAATSGGGESHQRNSIDSVRHLLEAADRAGGTRVVHVSSIAVLQQSMHGSPVREDSPLVRDARALGPYVWGKTESERLALALGTELGLQVKIVRPGALFDERSFDPPGRLGKRLGNLFVAVGAPNDRLGAIGVREAAMALAELTLKFDHTPQVLNLISPEPPAKRDLLRLLRAQNPDLSVIWLPRVVLTPLSWTFMLAQKILRPSQRAVNVAAIFAPQWYDTTLMRTLYHRGNDLQMQGASTQGNSA